MHCSGAGDLDLLASAAAQGAQVGGFHPLRMFGEPGKSFEVRGSAVAVAGPAKLSTALERIARAIGARPLRVPEGGRALYHLGANFSGAFIVALIAESVALWKRLGISERDATRAPGPASAEPPGLGGRIAQKARDVLGADQAGRMADPVIPHI